MPWTPHWMLWKNAASMWTKGIFWRFLTHGFYLPVIKPLSLDTRFLILYGEKYGAYLVGMVLIRTGNFPKRFRIFWAGRHPLKIKSFGAPLSGKRSLMLVSRTMAAFMWTYLAFAPDLTCLTPGIAANVALNSRLFCFVAGVQVVQEKMSMRSRKKNMMRFVFGVLLLKMRWMEKRFM